MTPCAPRWPPSSRPRRRCPPPGAAVAFVGAGGAGKTRCAAALASAYAKGSTLAASVVSLGSDDWGGDLKELLKGQNVWVMGAANGAEAAPAVQHGRDGGLVVLDTAAATPARPGHRRHAGRRAALAEPRRGLHRGAGHLQRPRRPQADRRLRRRSARTASRSPTPTRPTSSESPPSCRTSAACRSPTSTMASSSTARCRPPIRRSLAARLLP